MAHSCWGAAGLESDGDFRGRVALKFAVECSWGTGSLVSVAGSTGDMLVLLRDASEGQALVRRYASGGAGS
jgi:hypothetical protein